MDQEFNEDCIYCESGDLDIEYLSGAYDSVTQSVKCNDCGKSFKIYSETKWFVVKEDKNDNRTDVTN